MGNFLKDDLEKIFENEDITKPENRLNIALFHLLMIDEVKSFITEQLQLDPACVIYPPTNLKSTGIRIDFAIEVNGEIIDYIESELYSDEEQVEKYRKITGKKIYTIYGKKEYQGAYLGLDELYWQCLLPFVKTLDRADQRYWSMLVPLKIIQQLVIKGGRKKGSKRQKISKLIENHPIVKSIREKIPNENIIEWPNNLKKGCIKLDAIAEDSLSVRVYPQKKTKNGLRVITKSSKGDDIEFPSYGTLLEYMKNEKFANEYAEILMATGLHDYKNTSKGISLSIRQLEKDGNIDKLVDCIKKHCIF